MGFISNEYQNTALKGGRSFACGRWGVAVAASFMIAWGGVTPALAAGNAQKVSVPTVQKQVAELSEDGRRTWGELADADAGEPVPYRVVGSLPSNWDSFRTYRYEFHDEFSDEMAVDLASVKVVIKDGDKGSLDVTQAFDVKLDGRELSVSTSDLKAASPDVSKDAKVFLTYSASINPDGFAAGPSKPKKNFAHIVYTAKPDVQRAADGATAKTKEDGATVYTWALAINKIAQDGNAPLEGAVFTLEDRDGKYVAANGSRSDKPIELTSDSDGVVYVAGLDAGAYVLRETKAPAGYEIAAKPINVTIESHFENGVPDLNAREDAKLAAVQVDDVTGDVVLTVQNRASVSNGGTVKPVKPGADDADKDKLPGTGGVRPGNLAQTGDGQMLMIAGTAIAGAIAIVVAGAWRRHRKSGLGE